MVQNQTHCCQYSRVAYPLVGHRVTDWQGTELPILTSILSMRLICTQANITDGWMNMKQIVFDKNRRNALFLLDQTPDEQICARSDFILCAIPEKHIIIYEVKGGTVVGEQTSF